jgi:glycosyltransferase involved in cell wall biosynthesis
MRSAGRSDPTVSVVIPVRDDAATLRRCLRSLTRQTRSPTEIIVVDNASTDDSAAVAARYGARVVPEPAVGIPAAAAAGYDAARADVIARCDADTVPPPDWVAHIAAVMGARPGLDALTGSGRFYDLPPWLGAVMRPMYLGTYYVLVHAALGHRALWGSNMAMRRSTWEQVRTTVHRCDPEIHDDMDLSFALGPRRDVRYDRTLVVGVSARSLRGRRQLRRRLDRAVRTLQVNWRLAPPWERWHAHLSHTVGSVGAWPTTRTSPTAYAKPCTV